MGQELMGEEPKPKSEASSRKRHIFSDPNDHNGQHVDARSASGQGSNKKVEGEIRRVAAP